MYIAPSSRLPLFCFAVIWISASVAQVVLNKWFQFLLTPQIPWFLADLAGAGFVFTAPFYVWFVFEQSIKAKHAGIQGESMKDLFKAPYSTRRIQWHMWSGLTMAIQLVSISFALTMMPGSTFTVIRSSELLIGLILSVIVFKKVFNKWHYLSIVMMLTGGSMTALAMAKPAQAQHHEYNMPLGILITVFGVAGSSTVQAILTEWVYKQKILVKSRNDHLLEAGVYSMVFCCLWQCLFTACFSGGEYRMWWSTLSPHLNGLNITLLVILCASRAIALVAKIGVTAHSDAMFNRTLSTVRRATQITIMAILFHEPMSFIAISGILLTLAACLLYGLAKSPTVRSPKADNLVRQDDCYRECALSASRERNSYASLCWGLPIGSSQMALREKLLEKSVKDIEAGCFGQVLPVGAASSAALVTGRPRGIGFVIVIPVYFYFCVKRVRYEKKSGLVRNPGGRLINVHQFALKMLPGSTFTVVRGSELLITLSLSIFFFGKPYNMYHYTGVAAMIAGGLMVSMATAQQEEVDRNGINVAAGVAITFFGVAFTSCSQAVLVEWLYHNNVMVKKRYDHLMEISLYTTMWTAIVLLVGTYFFSEGEYHMWTETISETIAASPVTTWLCLIGLTISRALAMTTKVGVTVHSDAMFNRSLTTIRRVCQISSMAILFHEHLSALALIGILVSIAASSLYAAAASLGSKRPEVHPSSVEGDAQAPLLAKR
ncbi:hypothetical protein FOZ60_000174 [Perkinsus olseni]|uniref:Uncharacterized protein n=3 Tax=Perkinsus olseni TaxID=32597 RepID=A0A7J6PK19_PEROL|nr:hypothetical protein FOZ60_000174 [Perkinsus olseni]